MVKRCFSMEKKIVYFKLMQFVLTLAFIWQLNSLNHFCGTFADPKAFLHDISVGHCESFTLIGKDSKSGEFGAVFVQHKWHNQLSMNSTNGQLTEEQQRQFFDELAAKLPPAGRQCIPITITPFEWFFDAVHLYRNPLNNDTLIGFSDLFWYALLSLVPFGNDIKEMRRSMEQYKIDIFWHAFASIIACCGSVVDSFKLLFYWTDFWTCVNFRADYTNVPLITLVISIVMVCLSIFEIVLHKFVLNDVDTESANVMIIDQQQQKKKNGSACCAIE